VVTVMPSEVQHAFAKLHLRKRWALPHCFQDSEGCTCHRCRSPNAYSCVSHAKSANQ
jgi:hypothetical protein